MGLDMYIFKTSKDTKARTKLFDDIQKAVKADEKASTRVGDFFVSMHWVGSNMENHVDKLNPAAYWRKANHIHEWFSVNVLGNQPGTNGRKFGRVSKEQLLELRGMCTAVLTRCTNESNKIEIDEDFCRMMFPPTESVPYGGSTEYGEEFIEDMQTTIEQIEKLLHTTNFQKNKLFYYSYY